MKKKLLSMLLVVVMVASVMPFGLMGAFAVDKIVEVSDFEGLYNIIEETYNENSNADLIITLTDDIEMNGTIYIRQDVTILPSGDITLTRAPYFTEAMFRFEDSNNMLTLGEVGMEGSLVLDGTLTFDEFYEDYYGDEDPENIYANEALIWDDCESWNILNIFGSVTLQNNRVRDNYGGAIYLSRRAELNIDGATIQNNVVENSEAFGGGIYVGHECDIQINNAKIINNIAKCYPDGGDYAYGGGIYSNSVLDLDNTLVEGNEAYVKAWEDSYADARGSGIFVGIYEEGYFDRCLNTTEIVDFKELKIVNSSISNNKLTAIADRGVRAEGAGICFDALGYTARYYNTNGDEIYFNFAEKVTIDGTSIDGNTITMETKRSGDDIDYIYGRGAGVAFENYDFECKDVAVNITNSSIDENKIDLKNGAIYVRQDNDEESSLAGAGVYVKANGEYTIGAGTTISNNAITYANKLGGNELDLPKVGGAIAVECVADIILNGGEISGNRAEVGAGIYTANMMKKIINGILGYSDIENFEELAFVLFENRYDERVETVEEMMQYLLGDENYTYIDLGTIESMLSRIAEITYELSDYDESKRGIWVTVDGVSKFLHQEEKYYEFTYMAEKISRAETVEDLFEMLKTIDMLEIEKFDDMINFYMLAFENIQLSFYASYNSNIIFNANGSVNADNDIYVNEEIAVVLNAKPNVDFVARLTPSNYNLGRKLVKVAYDNADLNSLLGKIQVTDAGLRPEGSEYLVLSEGYKVEFKDEDGKELKAPQFVGYGAPAVAPQAPEKEGYEFIGWIDADGNSVDVDNIVKDVVLYPDYAIIKHTVTFIIGEGDTVTKEVNYGETVTAPQDPQTEGYDFIGWFDDDDKEVNVAEMVIKSDVTLTAKYQIKTYTVTFVIDDESSEQEVKHGETITTPEIQLLEGKTAVWVDENGDFVEVGESLLVVSNTTLTAQYQDAIYTVQVMLDEENPIEIQVKHGDGIEEKLLELLEEELLKMDLKIDNFDISWLDFESDEEVDITNIVKDMSIYPLISFKSYTVRFIKEGEKDICEPKEVVLGKYLEEIPQAPYKVGYSFVGWRLVNSDEIYTNEELKTLPITDNMEFGAYYEKDKDIVVDEMAENYKIVFKNEHTGEEKVEPVTGGGRVGIPKPARKVLFCKDCFRLVFFIGWQAESGELLTGDVVENINASATYTATYLTFWGLIKWTFTSRI